MKMDMKTKKLDILPAGTYFVGDPCYAISDENWMDVLDETGYFGMLAFGGRYGDSQPQEKQHGMFKYRGHYMGASSTEYGDGEYYDQDGRSYGVDAGMIGVVHESCIGSDASGLHGGHMVTFDSPFTISYDAGVISIGNIRIPTGNE